MIKTNASMLDAREPRDDIRPICIPDNECKYESGTIAEVTSRADPVNVIRDKRLNLTECHGHGEDSEHTVCARSWDTKRCTDKYKEHLTITDTGYTYLYGLYHSPSTNKCNKKQPRQYTRVSAFGDWIRETAEEMDEGLAAIPTPKSLSNNDILSKENACLSDVNSKPKGTKCVKKVKITKKGTTEEG